MYSLSTCWNSHRHTDGRAMLREIRDLGFEYAELSHGVRISLLPGIIEAVDGGEIRISTLHNFCPLPMGVNQASPNLFKFSSQQSRERENAWRYSLKTLETAQRLQAMHLGSLADRLAGFHIHDVQFPARDHCPPGAGKVDFGALKPMVKPEHIKVFEMSPGVAVEDLKRGVEYLVGLWGKE